MDSQNIKIHNKFSVAISVYNKDNPKYFDRALESIYITQTVKPSEIVLVVDGPISNEINKVIEKYQDICGNTLKVIYLEQNCGLANALSIAIENSSYELIARMDSDDISVPNRFEQQLTIMNNNPNVDIVGGDITEFIDDEFNIVATRRVPCSDNDIKDYMKIRCAMNHVSVMYKKASVQNSGGYLDLFWDEDYYLWIRMLEHNCIMANTGTVLVNVRTGFEMYKRRGGRKYYLSEKYLQRYMLEKKIINYSTYVKNIAMRWILQIVVPDALRGWLFRQFAREHDCEL